MYVRQSDSENRPSRASAFNVRQTIEKRQLQQERRERRALRERIREQLRSLSEGRERKDSSSSHVSSVHSQNSVRSKSMSSLDQDQEDYRSESPLFKVQSSPTLEKEKEEVRSYLFGASNLTESGEDSRTISPPPRHRYQYPRKVSSSCCPHQHQVQECESDLKHSKVWQGALSWNALKTDQEVVDTRRGGVSKSDELIQLADQESVYSSSVSSGSAVLWWKEHRPFQGEHRLQLSGHSPAGSPEPLDVCSADQASAAPITKQDKPYDKGEDSPITPIPPPRRHRLSLSAGQITLEEEEKPSWIRLAKERRSLRTARQVDQLSDRASTANTEPEWVSRARKKLESLNVTLTSTTDFNCGSSCVTESSSAWSRGGLDALDDLREETSRIGEELAEEATSRLNKELGLPHTTSKMLEHTPTSRDPSVERPRVSFNASATETPDGDSTRRLRTRRSQKEEVRFGDLKHDWGGAQTKTNKVSNGKLKEMRFGEVQVKETPVEVCELSQETKFGDSVVSATSQKAQTTTESATEKRPVMRFGDTPLDLFPNGGPRGNTNSSKFESVAGPDPTKMTAEQLNQNVEEYDFPIPTGKEDASELMKFLEESLKKVEVVPEVVCSEDDRPKPKSILKRRSVENVLQELKREEQSDWLQKVEHRKSASFDWDCVGKGGDAGLDTTHTKTHGHTHTKTHTNQSNSTYKPMQDQHHTPPTSTSTATSTSTSTFTATNASFFNVKLRHVSPNSRQPAGTNDSLRFHTEQSVHRHTHGVYMNGERHSGEFSSLSVLPSSSARRERTQPLDQGGGSHGSSPASSLESLSDSRGSSPTTDQTTVHTMRVALCNTNQEEHRWVSRRIRVQEEHSKTQNDCSTQDTSGHRVGVQVKLQLVQEPSAPAWATCRTGRTFTTSEPKGESIPARPAVTTSSETEVASSYDIVTSHIDIVHHASSYPVSSDTTVFDTDYSGLSAVTLCNSTTTSLSEDISSAPSIVHQFSIEEERGYCKVLGAATNPVVPMPNEADEERSETYSQSNDGGRSVPSPQAPTHTTHPACPASHPLSITPTTKAAEEEELPCFKPDPTSASTAASTSQQGDTATKTSQTSRIPHDFKDDSVRPPAKVFSFTVSSDQTCPEATFRDMDRDSLVHLKRQKESENMRRTEGAKTSTVISSPNDRRDGESNKTTVNGHVTHLTSFSEQSSQIKSSNTYFNDQMAEQAQAQPSVAPTKPARTKQSIQSVVSGERRKGEDQCTDISPQHTVHQVRVEVVDEEARKESQRRKEERRRGSLLEWEALQRQRLEEEERNRINKNLSMKPVSAKIKELVKMHGNFMSMFSRDKKTDINGTVDGKDDIVFKKISPEIFHPQGKGDVAKDVPTVMRSPYMVKKVASPGTSHSCQSHRLSRRDSPRRQSSTRKTSPSPRRSHSRSRPVADKKDQTSHRILTESNWKNSFANRESLDKTNLKHRSSVSPSRRKKTNVTSSSPDRRRDRSKEKISYPKSAEIIAQLPKISKSKPDSDCTSDPHKFSPPVPSKSVNIHERSFASSQYQHQHSARERSREWEKEKEKSSQGSFHHEKRGSPSRSSIKDPQNRKEWLNKMLSSISSDQTTTTQQEHKASPSPLRSVKKIEPVMHPDTHSSEVVTPVPPARKSASLWTKHETVTSLEKHYSSPVSPQSSTSLSSTSALNVPKPASFPSYLTKSSTESINLPHLSNPSLPITPASPGLVKGAVSHELCPQTSIRGPVSLSSILGDSSRSSSLTSTPLGSPRATPERMFKKDSLDPVSKLDIILESSAREDRKGRFLTKEQKENIAPSPPVNKYIDSYKETDQKETPNYPHDSTVRLSFRYKERNEDRWKGMKKEEEDETVQKPSCSWQPSQFNPFTFGRPSVTLKTMSPGWENQESNNPDHKNRQTDITRLSPVGKKFSTDLSCNASHVSCEKNSLPIRSLENLKVPEGKIEMNDNGKMNSENHDSFVSRFSNERSSIRATVVSKRSSPDRDGGPVSLSTILSKEAGARNFTAEEPSSFDFEPKLNFSEELNNITQNYCSNLSTKHTPSVKRNESSLYTKKSLIKNSDSDVFDETTVRKGNKMKSRSVESKFKEASPTRDIRRMCEIKPENEKSPGQRSKAASPSSSPPKGPPKQSATGICQPKTRVQRNSSMKRNRQEELRSSMRVKKERKDSEDDQGAIQDETVVQDAAGWTRTKTTVRRARLGSGDKARQIVRTNSGKTRKERNFKANASQALENWAAGTSVQGKLVKKEGQRFSHESEEEVRGGQRTAKSVVRRVVRRGSRRLSGGGELLTETKETSTSGAAKDGKNSTECGESLDGQEGVLVSQDDGVSRRMKTSTDGERYVTHSVSDCGGATTYTTQGINNKTTTSVEVIGGDDFAGRRAVEGKTGERLVVECTQDPLGRPSTVVKKVTSQSRVIITKTKRKSPVIV